MSIRPRAKVRYSQTLTLTILFYDRLLAIADLGYHGPYSRLTTGVNAAGDAGDTSPPNILVGGDVNRNIPPNIITYFRI